MRCDPSRVAARCAQSRPAQYPSGMERCGSVPGRPGLERLGLRGRMLALVGPRDAPMTPGSVHPFRPSTDRARCADCSLGADQHDVATLLAASIDATAHRGLFCGCTADGPSLACQAEGLWHGLPKPRRPTPKRRGRPPGPQPATRADRIRLGLPVCQKSGCHRAPGRGRGKPRPHCPLHACVLHRARRPKSLGPSIPRLLLFPLALDAAAQRAAYAESLSLAEWVRRAIRGALERQTPAMGKPADGV